MKLPSRALAHLAIALSLIAGAGCERAPRPEPDPYFAALTDFVDTDRADLEKFLDRFYPIFEKHRILNLESKEAYLSGFADNPELRRQIRQLLTDQLRRFFERASVREEAAPYRFFLRKVPGAKKTLIYLNAPTTSLVYNTNLLNQLMDKLPEVNLVVIDGSEVLYTEHGLGPDELRKKAATDLGSVLRRHGLDSTEKTLHVICHGIFYSLDILAGGKELYDKATFYAPTIRNRKKDRVLSAKVVYPAGDARARFVDYVYQSRIAQGTGFHYFPIPRSQQEYNQPLEAAFSADYDKGIDLSKARERWLLLPEVDHLVPPENAGIEFFAKDKVKLIPDIYHSDIFTRKITSSNYVDTLRSIISP